MRVYMYVCTYVLARVYVHIYQALEHSGSYAVSQESDTLGLKILGLLLTYYIYVILYKSLRFFMCKVVNLILLYTGLQTNFGIYSWPQ